MARQIVPAAERKSCQVHILLSPPELESLDRARGEQNRSEYLRAALLRAVAAQGVAP